MKKYSTLIVVWIVYATIITLLAIPSPYSCIISFIGGLIFGFFWNNIWQWITKPKNK